MANNGISFQGFDELAAVLEGLPGRLGDQTVNTILRKAAAPLVTRARALSSNADVTGYTTKSIGILANRRLNLITMGPRRGGQFKGYIAHLLEYGTAPHVIRAKAAGGHLRFGGKAYTSVNHPGTAAQPFMRPAYDETKGAVVESIKAQCKEIITSGFKSVFK